MATILMERLVDIERERKNDHRLSNQMDNYVDPMDIEFEYNDHEDLEELGEYSFEDEEPKEDGEMDNYIDPLDDIGIEGDVGEPEEETDEEQLEDVVDVATEDQDRQGLIRTVPGAHLVSKRKSHDDTYTELWLLKCDNVQDSLKIRKDILAGTDIPIHRTVSDDDGQRYTSWTAGNIQMLKIEGLPH